MSKERQQPQENIWERAKRAIEQTPGFRLLSNGLIQRRRDRNSAPSENVDGFRSPSKHRIMEKLATLEAHNREPIPQYAPGEYKTDLELNDEGEGFDRFDGLEGTNASLVSEENVQSTIADVLRKSFPDYWALDYDPVTDLDPTRDYDFPPEVSAEIEVSREGKTKDEREMSADNSLGDQND